MIATVYGLFHDVLDTLAGATLAIAVVAAHRYLSGGGLQERWHYADRQWTRWRCRRIIPAF